MPWRFVHASDIHLDSPQLGVSYIGRGMDSYDTEFLASATAKALDNLVETVIETESKFLLIAGDLYDHDWRDYRTGLYFTRKMGMLKEADIPVYIVLGNHDKGSSITRRLRLPENVHVFSDRQPHSYVIPELDVVIHGQSYPIFDCRENLAKNYPKRIDGKFNIGLLHTALTGREFHQPYAPCTVQDLLEKRYDYWALGHVHSREIVHRQPYIAFSGMLQARHINERGPKGCYLVEVQDNEVTNIIEKNLDTIRWEKIEVNVEGMASLHQLLDLIRTELEAAKRKNLPLPLAVRLKLFGTTPLHHELVTTRHHWKAEIYSIVEDIGNIFVERVEFATVQFDIPQTPSQRPDALALLLQKLTNAVNGQIEVEDFLDNDCHQLLQKLRSVLGTSREKGLDTLEPFIEKKLAAEAAQLLLAKLGLRAKT